MNIPLTYTAAPGAQRHLHLLGLTDIGKFKLIRGAQPNLFATTVNVTLAALRRNRAIEPAVPGSEMRMHMAADIGGRATPGILKGATCQAIAIARLVQHQGK